MFTNNYANKTLCILSTFKYVMLYALLFGVCIIMGKIMIKDNKEHVHTSYVYSPGLLGSPVVIGRYCSYYVAPTGEEIHGTRGGRVLGDGTRITAVVFPEINIKRSNSWFRRIIYPMVSRKVFLSMFGIIVKDDASSDSSFSNYLPHVTQANIAQEADINALRKKLYEHCKKYPNTKVVMYGDSRGAATTFNLIALDHPQIACAVLEGAFDSIPHLIKHCWHWKTKHASIEGLLHGFLKMCTSCYAENGPFPIDYVDKMPLDVPLLFVTSLADEIVPYQSTMRLYCRLKERGCYNVHLLVLSHSTHKEYMVGKDRDTYESCVHAFYRAYGVEHDKSIADKGQHIFEATKPTVDYIRVTYNITDACCQ